MGVGGAREVAGAGDLGGGEAHGRIGGHREIRWRLLGDDGIEGDEGLAECAGGAVGRGHQDGG